MELRRVEDYDAMSLLAARIVFDRIVNSERLVLGLATGSTPEAMYDHLAEMLNRDKVDLSHVYTVNLDEYVGLSEGHPQSYHHYMETMFFSKVDIPADHTFLPDGKAPDLEVEVERYELLIEELGGVDLQILGIGRNGHIGFNEPGTSFDSRTHVVNLAESTVNDNARFFDTVDEVPRQALTMGLHTIMNAKSILLLVSGDEKEEALECMIDCEVSEELPATILQTHPDVTIIADDEALE
ncbi:glucosamine-6-phosphate deaminase [Salinicoccus sp. ID82-1]|uniref:glucosamine-6-phosphate deaminase n=1 Tax=Salinicoccus sp. ID82-1 TaxID=2820269 RepID=UPI001F002CAD|nr:glucosamine-6-phosphate deaminase [Salinicoccus sp. ID82-1]MCG1010810.1 glucosamine-6-phosphate deaminase [Salinicoccus sp. ID82-1]